jgi:hypothetical protein
MSHFEEMKGKEIIVASWRQALLEEKDLIIVTKLIDVELSGIWVEARELAKVMHERFKESIIPRMPIFFVPFAQIASVSDSADYPSLSEKGLGL